MTDENKLLDLMTEPRPTCKDCKHRERWHYRSGLVIQYCGVRSSNRTFNGKLKIKCKNTACSFFEKDNNNESNNQTDTP